MWLNLTIHGQNTLFMTIRKLEFSILRLTQQLDELINAVQYATTGKLPMTLQTLEQALKIALAVHEAEKQEKFSESFYASFDDSSSQHSRNSSRRASHRSHGSADADYTVNHTQGQQNTVARDGKRSKTAGTRNARTKAALSL